MNAIRQFVTSGDGSLTIKLPKEYSKKKLEVIVMPATDDDFETDKIGQIMDKMSDRAEKNGLTPEILNELLND